MRSKARFDFFAPFAERQAVPHVDLLARLGVNKDGSSLRDPVVQAALYAHSEWAIAAGVRDLPSFVASGQVFSSEDVKPVSRAFPANPTGFDSAKMQGIATLRAAASRLCVVEGESRSRGRRQAARDSAPLQARSALQ
jgi:hypothetical protein